MNSKLIDSWAKRESERVRVCDYKIVHSLLAERHTDEGGAVSPKSLGIARMAVSYSSLLTSASVHKFSHSSRKPGVYRTVRSEPSKKKKPSDQDKQKIEKADTYSYISVTLPSPKTTEGHVDDVTLTGSDNNADDAKAEQGSTKIVYLPSDANIANAKVNIINSSKRWLDTPTRNAFLTQFFSQPEQRSRQEWRNTTKPTKRVLEARAVARASCNRVSSEFGVFNVTARVNRRRGLRVKEVDDVVPGPGAYNPQTKSALTLPSMKFSQVPRAFVPVPVLHDTDTVPSDGKGFGEQQTGAQMSLAPRHKGPSIFETSTPGPDYDPYPQLVKNDQGKKRPLGYKTTDCSRDFKKVHKLIDTWCRPNIRLPGDFLHPCGKRVKIHEATRLDHANIGGFTESLRGRVSATWQSEQSAQRF